MNNYSNKAALIMEDALDVLNALEKAGTKLEMQIQNAAETSADTLIFMKALADMRVQMKNTVQILRSECQDSDSEWECESDDEYDSESDDDDSESDVDDDECDCHCDCECECRCESDCECNHATVVVLPDYIDTAMAVFAVLSWVFLFLAVKSTVKNEL
jgi:hypothetical protein